MHAVTDADLNHVVLYSLEPGEKGLRDAHGACVGNCYFGVPALGQAQLKLESSRAVLGDLATWITAPEPTAVAACFNPRHGVHLVANGHAYDFVVCFECGGAEVFKDGAERPFAWLYRGGSPKAWNALLQGAHVPLAEPPSP
jgi:hypothetical protein